MSGITETLRTWAVQDVVQDKRANAGLGVFAFVLATALGAQVAVPLPWTTVPMTLQPLFVVLAGAVLGPWIGATAMTTYLMIGAAGAPVFSLGGAGLPWLLGPTGGYLIAAPAAAFVAGWLVARARSEWAGGRGLAAGVATMYVGGVAQLMILTGQSFGAVLAMGVVPFLSGDVTKILIAVAALRMVRGPRRSA